MANQKKVTNKTPKKPSVNFDRTKFYTIEEAVNLAKQTSNAKFLSSIDIAIKLNLDTSKSDQQLRGTVSLPYFFGKEKRILVLDKGLTQKDAKSLGVNHAGDSELIAEISKGWLDFDLIITTPKMMPELSKLGKILGTRGLMPNPKNGNVTTDLPKTIAEFKKGINQYRTDSYGNIHMVVGKANADTAKIVENINFLLSFIAAKRLTSVKGIFIEKVNLSSTMGPGIRVLVNKTAVVKKTAKGKVIADDSAKGENKKPAYLIQRVKYAQKKKPSKHPENPPVITEAKKKKVKKILKKAKPAKKAAVAKKPVVVNKKTATKKSPAKKGDVKKAKTSKK
ncbi:ribosomal protein L1 [Malacoplasma penetrans HF-2]|uniref:Large ribosomal subunit protein uL1 n=1 Tax=Malacoplasma penetrans (strain HF-2) TaxID=272633 RepID=RL1_MALP2|nr:50S ribosomal protein L1 [Malacoplasma penetrans]Q8EX24.1 RecName: Full=Large ribosomal subunit protein uL1; AltName: Full=50S ribosomal protein L1 [Malacoplasma penetrans HF-2]BAC43816.1 ribosomal protein L1 [Malacoplasma penetrans HF-2]